MLTFKNITTGISILFGVYSMYNIFEYLRIIERYRLKKTNNFYYKFCLLDTNGNPDCGMGTYQVELNYNRK